MKKIVLVATAFLLIASRAFAELTFSYSPNQEKDLGKYVLHYGNYPRQYTESINIGIPEAGKDGNIYYTFETPPDGWQYYALTACDKSGNCSPYSEEVYTINRPKKPKGFRVFGITEEVLPQ